MKRRITVLTVALVGAAVLAGVASAASSPSVVTGSHTAVKQNSAVLNGIVNPNGSTTTYYFQWGLTNSYGLNSNPHSAGRGVTGVAVLATAGGLIPGTIYHYRLVATNKFGVSSGADRMFKTAGFPPPDATTGPPTQVAPSSATVTGVINPHGAATTWVFQYGLTSVYTVQTFGGSVPAGSAPVVVAQTLEGLEPGTFFHYRLVALHGSSVVSYGADQSFMTEPSPRPTPRLRAATVPHRARRKPYVFTTSGTVVGPARIPAPLACTGNVTVLFVLGYRQVGSTLAPVQPNCTFSGQTVFRGLPGRGPKNRQVLLRVLIHFEGNGYLTPAGARAETVLLG